MIGVHQMVFVILILCSCTTKFISAEEGEIWFPKRKGGAGRGIRSFIFIHKMIRTYGTV